jgi:hypothetical protein
MRTTSWSILNYSTATESTPACNTCEACMSPYSTRKYSILKVITVSCSHINQYARSYRAGIPVAVQNPVPFHK